MQTTKESLDKGKGDNDGDEDMLQAALAESQRRMEINQSAQSGTTEVLYNDGATPLFTAIEETKWTDALDLLEVVPEQAKIWVASTGTENTTFGWSLWRRLPIHEVCTFQPSAYYCNLLACYSTYISQKLRSIVLIVVSIVFPILLF